MKVKDKKEKNQLRVLRKGRSTVIHAFPTRTGDLLERIQILTRKYRKGTEKGIMREKIIGS